MIRSCFSIGTTLLAILLAAPLTAPSAFSQPQKSQDKSLVDSGIFEILVNSRPTATEQFEIRQGPDGSVTRSELRLQSGSSNADQTFELRLNTTGNLQRYQWNEKSPGKSSVVVEPDGSGELLVQHIYATGSGKPVDQQFLLSTSTMILDDYSFVQRQLLIWRYMGAYMATGCRMQGGVQACTLPKTQMGVLVPRQRSSGLVDIEYKGRQTVAIRGTPHDLHHFRLEADGTEWNLWLDDAHHLQRVQIPSLNTEVLRK